MTKDAGYMMLGLSSGVNKYSSMKISWSVENLPNELYLKSQAEYYLISRLAYLKHLTKKTFFSKKQI